MLAYVFWHRPRRGVSADEYEEAQRRFHEAIEAPSACFRLARLPFADGGGYEDWYLVDDWSDLGDLNAAAVDEARRPAHDRAAADSVEGWGGVYAAVQGPATIPEGTEWHHKPRLVPVETFISDLPETTIWRRQLVLGPAPEFCVVVAESPDRERICP
jgi:hypothetical protein